MHAHIRFLISNFCKPGFGACLIYSNKEIRVKQVIMHRSLFTFNETNMDIYYFIGYKPWIVHYGTVTTRNAILGDTGGQESTSLYDPYYAIFVSGRVQETEHNHD